MSDTYGKGRTFDQMAEIAQARLKRIRELEAALADAEERISVLYWEAVEARAALAAGGRPPGVKVCDQECWTTGDCTGACADGEQEA